MRKIIEQLIVIIELKKELEKYVFIYICIAEVFYPNFSATKVNLLEQNA